jgi:hypothetical protein
LNNETWLTPLAMRRALSVAPLETLRLLWVKPLPTLVAVFIVALQDASKQHPSCSATSTQ